MKKNKTSRKFLATAMAAIMVILIFVALTPSTAQTQPMDPILSTKTVEVKPGTQDVDKSIKEVEVKQGTKADVDKSIKNVTVKEGTKADVDKSIKEVEVKQGTKDVDKSNNKPVKVENRTKDVDKSNKTAKSPGCEDSDICGTYISEGYDPNGDGCLGSFFLEIDADTPGDDYCDVKAFIQASTGESWWTTCWTIYDEATSDNAFIYFVASEFDISGCEEVTLTIQLYTCDGEYTGSSDTVYVSLDASEVPPCENSDIYGTYISEGYDPDGDGCLGSFFLEIDADTPGSGQYCDVKAFIQASTGESWWTNCWMINGWAMSDNAFIYFDASEFATTAECEEVILTVDLYTCDGEYTGSSNNVYVSLDASEVPPCEDSDIWSTDISYGVDDDSDGCLDSFYLEIDADTPGSGQYCDVKAYIQATTGESWWTNCWMIYDEATSDNAFIYFDASEFATTEECEEVILTVDLYPCDGEYTGYSDTVSVCLEYEEPVCEKSYIWGTYISNGVDDDGDGCLESFDLEIDADTPRYDQYCDVKAYIEASTGESWWTTCWEIYDGAISDNAFIHFDASEFATTTECEEVTLTTYLYTCDGVNTGSSDAKSANVESEPQEIHWTFMVYLDGDNNLESYAIADFLEMSSVSSTAGVNIVVQFDRRPGYSNEYDDWATCKRFLVTPGMTPTPANALTDLGECNMGDPDTLSDFVDWAMTQYPADNYALILWDHGSGWKEKKWVPWEDETGIARWICMDDTNGYDYLTLQETEQALAGKSLSLLGYDACLMHMVEVVYQVMDNAGISVGSEESEQGDGWPYNTILSDLTGTPTMTPTTLGTTIVQRYIEFYGTGGDDTQSAVDNGDVSGLVTAVDNLAQALMTEINAGHWTQVQEARNAAEEIYYTYYIDLYHFAEKIKTDVPGATAQAQAVMNSVNTTVYTEAHGTSVPNDHGLSIYYPRVEGDYLASYDNTAFASDTQWDEFLKRYYEGPDVCEGTATSCGIYPNCENCNEDDGCYPYDNGCEERDYYCVSNDVGCGYTYSNRHTDDWVDTGIMDWVDVNECQEKERKEQEYRDYYCSGGACTYNVTGTQWVDTGTMRNKPDGTICGCTASNTLKKCYGGVCTDTGICDATTCGADAACDGKVPGDSCGGGTCDSICECVPSPGQDKILFKDGIWYVDTNGDCVVDQYIWYGAADYIPLVGDINNDGNNDKMLFKDGWWYVDTNGDCVIDLYIWYGAADYIPLVGDINNDGNNDKILFKDGMWYVDTDGDCVIDLYIWYGAADYIPLVGDINNDGNNDKMLFKDGMWYVDTDGDCVIDLYIWYGAADYIPLVGDINNDGDNDKILFKDGMWYVDTDGDCVIDLYIWYGAADYIPLVGDMG